MCVCLCVCLCVKRGVCLFSDTWLCARWFGVWGLGLRVEGLGSGVWGLGLRVEG